MPAASCPGIDGSFRGRRFSIVDRSEWQSPAPTILYNTSPGPGGARSIVSIVIGWLSAYGRGLPCSRSTAAFICIVGSLGIAGWFPPIRDHVQVVPPSGRRSRGGNLLGRQATIRGHTAGIAGPGFGP